MRSAIIRRADHRRRGGLTLIELIVSMAIMSLLFLGMAGAVMLATRAIPTGEGSAENVEGAREVLGQLIEDLRVAVNITERTATAVTYTLRDRNDDGLPEVIRYSWSGDAGDPLLRKVNGVSAPALVDVHQFELAFETKDVVEEYPGPLVTSSELELSSHPNASGSQLFKVQSGESIGQYLEPTLPADAVAWSVTRVLFRAQKQGVPSGSTLVQLRMADDNQLPIAAVLEQDTMSEALLPSGHSWQEFFFNSVTGLAPTESLCLVLEWASGGGACEAEWDNASGAGRLETKDFDATWTNAADEVMTHYLYGTVVTPGAERTLTREHVVSVDIGLRSGADPGALVKTSVQTLNLPEALVALWEADFNADPTLLDLDADDTPDWDVSGSFDTAYLNGGIWTANGSLVTNPGHDFAVPTTVDIRFRDIYHNGQAGGIKLRVDRSGSIFAFIQAELALDGAGEQTLTISSYDASVNPVTLLTLTGLPDDFIDLRLLVDTDHETVHVMVDGRDHGTFDYERFFFLGSSHYCELYETADVSGLRFDSVRIRVGGTP